MFIRFFTNSGKSTLPDKFKGISENNMDIANFDALVGRVQAGSSSKASKRGVK